MNDEITLLKKLDQLRERHRELDNTLNNFVEELDQFTMARLKKEKLMLRDQITYIEQILYPDIIA